jgi:large subunit ribosomal protein L3
MTHCMAVDENKGNVTAGTEVFVPVTVIECPPLKVVGIRLYRKGYGGEETFTDIWCESPDKEIERRTSVPKTPNSAAKILEAGKQLKELSDIRLIAASQVALTNSPQKTPDIMELALKGTIEEMFAHAKEVLGKTISISDVFKENQFVDVIAVTKGKGYGGVIKRYGVRKQPRKAKGKRRHPGTGGSWHPAHKLWVEPLPGQIGYHTRTEFNKLIVKIGKNGSEISPAGGFLHYGPVKTDYIMLYGSVPGPAKRVIRLTFPRRDHKKVTLSVKYIDQTSKQGA